MNIVNRSPGIKHRTFFTYFLNFGGDVVSLHVAEQGSHGGHALVLVQLIHLQLHTLVLRQNLHILLMETKGIFFFLFFKFKYLT